jgi:hypothetical protein
MLLLTACGGVSDDEIDQALATAWDKDPATMAHLAQVQLPGTEPGSLRGIGTSAKAAEEIASAYGGEIAADLTRSAINGAAKVASDFDIEGAAELRDAVGVATAKNWQVRSLEVLARRESGDDYVATVRYDLMADINGSTQTLFKDVTHQLRLVEGSDGWQVERRGLGH